MLTQEEKEELERLKKDVAVKHAVKELKKKHPVDKEKKKLYQYRWLKKMGEKLLCLEAN